MRHEAAKGLTALRIVRTAFFVAWFAVALAWAVPRVVPRLVGDRVFLREEFFHPAVYEVGGLTIAGWTVGETAIDCSALRRPPAALEANLLANPGLDTPCGWGFAPHLGDKVAAEESASGGRCFRLEGETYAFQDVMLGRLAPWVDRGEAALSVAGRFAAGGPSVPRLVIQVATDDGGGWRTLAGATPTSLTGGRGWREFSGTVALPAGARVVRVSLGAGDGPGAVLFDDVSAVVRRRAGAD